MPPLSVMIKPVSSSCELRCRYCFYADVSAHRSEKCLGVMTEETARAIVRRAFIYADERVTFAFQGGEPTLAGLPFFEGFVRLVREYNTRGTEVCYSVQTNAVSLTDALCAFFAEHRFLVGVSLDGCETTHDAMRVDAKGEGTYRRVLDGIAKLRRHGVEYNVLCVVTREVAENAKEAWNALAPHRYIQFIPCIDSLDGDRRAYSLDAESYGEFLIETFDYYESAYRRGAPVSERRFDNYINILLGAEPELCSMCGVCGGYFLIEADGGAYPCDFYVLDEYLLGNIRDTSFARLEKSEAAVRFASESAVLPHECGGCLWRDICRGGCRRDREPRVGGEFSGNRFCESYKAFFNARFERLCELAKDISKRSQGMRK